MNIRDVSDTGQVRESSPEKPLESERSISSPVLPEMELGAIADVLDIDRKAIGKWDDQLNELLHYAKTQSKDHSLENLKWAIRSLELKLGTPPLAEKRITFLSRYAYLLKEESAIKKEKEAFEWGS